MRVFVLLFNARTDNEGIHTIKVGERNVILMFESEDDAIRFALMLEAQDFGNPTVEEFDMDELEEFCNSADYDYKIVSEGTLALPPEGRVEQTDWQPDAPPSPELSPAEKPELSQSDLEELRRRLEELL
ncbi:MAG: DUF3110 domain-containing protein [Leptolyngbyaceae cyanobacterium SM2_5_2]|nr:DUF3110 domain-containing protein [Leptolyngbyaceae cyanobacterium SM2_5_2]